MKLSNPTVTIGGQRVVFPITLESGQYVEYEGPGNCCVRNERGEILGRIAPQGEIRALAAGDNAIGFACEGPAEVQARANVTLISQGQPLAGRTPASQVDWGRLSTEYDDPRTLDALDGKQNAWTFNTRPGAKAAFGVTLTVDRATAPPGTAADKPLTIESCESAAGFADTPENKYKQYVYDEQDKGLAAKPGVIATLDPATDIVKTGQASLRYSATSKRGDAAGWCARGERFTTPLNLTGYGRLNCWVYGDAGGESLKLQLRDTSGGWQDMVTPVDFIGWKQVEFPLGEGGQIDLSKVEYLIVFFNGLPPGKTVTCYLDQIQAGRDTGGVHRPAFEINGQPLVFPVTLTTGERLTYGGSGEAVIRGKDGRLRRRCRPEGQPPVLKAGQNQVRFSFDDKATGEFKLRVQAVKEYR